MHEGGDPPAARCSCTHGTPGRGCSSPHAELAREQGVRLIGYDRPGYGGSTRQPGRRSPTAQPTSRALADALGARALRSWGISGGGPHVLACAALCDDRLVAVASLAAVAPYDAEGLDFLDGMGEENHVEFGKVLEGEAALRPYLEHEARRSSMPPEELVARDGDAARAGGSRAAPGGFAEYLLEGPHGLAPGIDGWLDDDIAFIRAWGFALEAIARPVLLLHGDDDRFVPVAHGRWLAERIPGVEARSARRRAPDAVRAAHARDERVAAGAR